MTHSYVDLPLLKEALEIAGEDDRRDSALTALIESASAAVDSFCGRVFTQSGTVGAPVARTYDTAGGLLVIDDLQSLSSLERESGLSGESWTAMDLTTVTLLPRNAHADERPFTMLRVRSGQPLPLVVRLTGVWGWASVPPQVKDATLLQCIRLRKSKDIPTGVVGGADFMGTMRLSGDLHPDAQTLLQSLVRPSVG